MDGDLRLQDAPATAAHMARALRVGAALSDAVVIELPASAARQVASQIDRALRDAAEVREARAMLARAQAASDGAARDLRATMRALWLDVAVWAGGLTVAIALMWAGGLL